MQIPNNCHENALIITELESIPVFPLTPSVHCTFLFTNTKIRAHTDKLKFFWSTNSFPCAASKEVAVNEWGKKPKQHYIATDLTFKIHTFKKGFLSPCCLTLDKSLNLFVPQFPICKMGIIMLTTMDKALVKC